MNKKLFLLKGVEKYTISAAMFDKNPNNPWSPPYDKMFGFVIRASSEEEAREIADKNSADEKRCFTVSPWLSNKYTTCEILEESGETGIILRDFNAG